jgi:hypothetical protein
MQVYLFNAFRKTHTNSLLVYSGFGNISHRYIPTPTEASHFVQAIGLERAFDFPLLSGESYDPNAECHIDLKLWHNAVKDRVSVIPSIIPSERGHTRSLATCPIKIVEIVA